ncbi:hypothetical protein MHI02_05815 [Oceanobacillus sp. FSL K6-0118]|uniref:hypothetical protein n=1 Tax=Oceanobacillus sp. FSL K6-0118 TaxID=2921418 RepID=UPI0030F5153F
MLEGILIGIFGNSIFAIIQGMITAFFGDKDDDLNDRIYESLELATKDFFKQYGEIYRKPHSSFLARESNIRLIVQSVYFGRNIDMLEELDKRGFDNEPDVSQEHLHYFVSSLEKLMREDFILDKLLEEKTHIHESKLANENIKEILEVVTGQSNNTTPEKKSNWQLTDLATGEEIPFREGKKYHQKYSNGVEQIFMIKGDIVSVDFKDEHGRWSYHEIDIKKGSANNNKFPYPVSDYKLVVNELDIINKTVTPLSNGYYQEEMTLKWGRTSKVIYDNKNRIQQFDVSGGWSVNHNSKTISPYNK